MNEQTAARFHELFNIYSAASGYIEAKNNPLYDGHLDDAYQNLVEAVHAAAPNGTDAKNAAAQALRSIPSEKRAQASRENGKAPVKPGSNPRGRPRKSE